MGRVLSVVESATAPKSVTMNLLFWAVAHGAGWNQRRSKQRTGLNMGSFLFDVSPVIRHILIPFNFPPFLFSRPSGASFAFFSVGQAIDKPFVVLIAFF